MNTNMTEQMARWCSQKKQGKDIPETGTETGTRLELQPDFC